MDVEASIEKRIQAEFRAAQARWREALDAHRLAPPDAGFSGRLAALSKAASAEAEACREAEAAGFEWPPHRAASSQPPYELRPDSGRRGPDDPPERQGLSVRPPQPAANVPQFVPKAPQAKGGHAWHKAPPSLETPALTPQK